MTECLVGGLTGDDNSGSVTVFDDGSERAAVAMVAGDEVENEVFFLNVVP